MEIEPDTKVISSYCHRRSPCEVGENDANISISEQLFEPRSKLLSERFAAGFGTGLLRGDVGKGEMGAGGYEDGTGGDAGEGESKLIARCRVTPYHLTVGFQTLELFALPSFGQTPSSILIGLLMGKFHKTTRQKWVCAPNHPQMQKLYQTIHINILLAKHHL